MRKLTAHYVFDGYEFRRNTLILVDNEGTILDVQYYSPESKELEGVEYYNGVLCPGFVNAHCHLELSFLANQINQSESLEQFIEQIKTIDRSYSEEKLQKAQLYDQLMHNEGISVCADISNTALTAKIKLKSPIHYYTFIELYSVDDTIADNVIKQGIQLKSYFRNASITPHAPYSVSFRLLNNIVNHATSDDIISIHFKESKYEDELFLKYQKQFQNLKNDESLSLQFIRFLPKHNNTLFVHNTYLIQNEAQEILHTFKNPYFVVCPNSNLYIEKSLPAFFLIQQYEDRLCIGTDSLASNTKLSIMEEIKTLSKNFKTIPFKTWLKMATINGAKALNVDDKYGSIEKGKIPGIVCIEEIDLRNLKVLNETFGKRIV